MAILIRLSSDDLAETRFAFSPIWELGMSLYKPMRDPAKHALHLPWVQEAMAAIEGRDLEILFAMVPPPGLPPVVHPYIPDFLTPAPETPFPQFEDELEQVARTEPARIRAELEHMVRSLEGAPVPPFLPCFPQLINSIRATKALRIQALLYLGNSTTQLGIQTRLFFDLFD
jgi:hypothetical protein